MSVNKAILIGRVGKDPEIKSFDNGGKIANFTIATSEKYKDRNGEKKEITDWHNITCSIPGIVGVIEQYLKKGDPIYIEGKIRTRSWEKDGQTKYITEVHLYDIQFLKQKNQGASTSTQSTGSFDDLPF